MRLCLLQCSGNLQSSTIFLQSASLPVGMRNPKNDCTECPFLSNYSFFQRFFITEKLSEDGSTRSIPPVPAGISRRDDRTSTLPYFSQSLVHFILPYVRQRILASFPVLEFLFATANSLRKDNLARFLAHHVGLSWRQLTAESCARLVVESFGFRVPLEGATTFLATACPLRRTAASLRSLMAKPKMRCSASGAHTQRVSQ